MAAASYPPFVSAGEYLARERMAETESEYINGRFYALAGAAGKKVRLNNDVLFRF